MVAVETREQSSADAVAFRAVPPSHDKRVATPHQYRVENLDQNDPLLLAFPYLYIDNRLLCLVIRLKGGVSGITRPTLIEEMKRAAETDGSLVVNPFQDILKDTREKFRRNGFPITIENLSPPSKPALYRFSDAERWVSPQEDAPSSTPVKEVFSPAQPTEIVTAPLAVVVPAPSSKQQVFPAPSDEQPAIAQEPQSHPDIPVTKAERQVIELSLKGFSETEIAKQLQMSRSGVSARLTRFSRRLGIKNREDFLRFGEENHHRMVVVSLPERAARQKPTAHQRPKLFPRSKPSSLAHEPSRVLPARPAKTAGTYAMPPRPARASTIPHAPTLLQAPDVAVTEPLEPRGPLDPRHPTWILFATHLVQHKLWNTLRQVDKDPQTALRQAVTESDVILARLARERTKEQADATVVHCVVSAIAWALNSLSNKGQAPEENNLVVHAVGLRSYGIEPIAIDLYWHFFDRPLPDNYLIGTSTNTTSRTRKKDDLP